MNETIWIPTSVPQDSGNAVGSSMYGESSHQSFGASFGLLIGYIAGVSALVMFAGFLRDFCCQRYDAQLESDRALAQELQRRLDEELDAERIIKENQRRIWYESYMKQFTMTAESKDLFFTKDLDDATIHKQEENRNEHVPPKTEVESRRRKYLPPKIATDEEVEDIEASGMTRHVCVAVANGKKDKDTQLYLRLPVKDEKGNFRTVDAECAICFSDYEVGDKISWSELQCHHAFHDDCILAWLVKGKKRCPTCRHWFVPGALIEDQKQELEERRLRAEVEGVASADDTQNESQSDSERQGTSLELALVSSLASEVDVESGNASEVAPVESAGLPSIASSSQPRVVAASVAKLEP